MRRGRRKRRAHRAPRAHRAHLHETGDGAADGRGDWGDYYASYETLVPRLAHLLLCTRRGLTPDRRRLLRRDRRRDRYDDYYGAAIHSRGSEGRLASCEQISELAV